MTDTISKSVKRVGSQYVLSSKPTINASNNSKQNFCQPLGKKIDNQGLVKKSLYELSRPNITTKALKFKKKQLQRSPILACKSKQKNNHTRSKNCLSKTPDYSQRSNSRSSYKKTEKKCAGKSMQIFCRVATNIKQVSKSKSKSISPSKSKEKKRTISNSRSISRSISHPKKSPCLKIQRKEGQKKNQNFVKKVHKISSSFSINFNNKSTQRQSPTIQAHRQDVELKRYLANKKKKIKSESLKLQQEERIKIKKKQQELIKVEKARKSNLKVSTGLKKKKVVNKKNKPLIQPFQQCSISEQHLQSKLLQEPQQQNPLPSKKISIRDQLMLEKNDWDKIIVAPSKDHKSEQLLDRYFKNRATSSDYFWLVNAAITIQKFWRGYTTRKQLAAKAKQKQLKQKIHSMQKRINNKQKNWLDKSSMSNYQQNAIQKVYEVSKTKLPKQYFPTFQKSKHNNSENSFNQLSAEKSQRIEEQLKKLKEELEQRRLNEQKLLQQNKLLKEKACKQIETKQIKQELLEEFESPRIDIKQQQINFSSPIPVNGKGFNQHKIQSPLSASFLKQSQNKKDNVIYIENHSSEKSSERKYEEEQQVIQEKQTKNISASIKERLQINISEMDSLNETGLINHLKAKSPKPNFCQPNKKFIPWNQYSEQKFEQILTHKISKIQEKFNKKAQMFEQLLQNKLLSPKTYESKLSILQENLNLQRKQIQQKKSKYKQALEILQSLSEQCCDQTQNYFKKQKKSPKESNPIEPIHKQFKITMNDTSTDMENIKKQVQQLDKRSLTIFEQVRQESPIEEKPQQQQLSAKKKIQGFTTDIYFLRTFLIGMANYIRDNPTHRKQFITNLQKPIHWNLNNFLKAFRTQERTLQNYSHFDGYRVDLLYHYFYLYFDKDASIPMEIFNDFTIQFKQQLEQNNKNHEILRAFFFEAIYDGFNEALQYERPGGPQGEELPWHHYTSVRPRNQPRIKDMNLQEQETFIDRKMGKAIDRMLQWYSTLCGFIPQDMQTEQDHTISFSDQQRDEIRQKRVALDLQRIIIEEENKFTDYTLSQTESKLVVTERVFYDIICEVIFDIKKLA